MAKIKGAQVIRKNKRGFSLIEILMALLIIGILSAIAITTFINFAPEARQASLESNLAILRNAIAAQYSQMQLRCDTLAGVFPPFANLVANDITLAATPCTAAEVPISSERSFVQGLIPVSPYTSPSVNTVIDCTAGPGDCVRGDATSCNGVAFTEQWCYDPTTGEIWLDSSIVTREAT